MARVIELADRFRSRLRSLGVKPGSPESKAIGSTVSALGSDATLPGPADVLAFTPPVGTALVRRVRGLNLWVWYHAEPDRVVVWSLHRNPPVPAKPELA